MILKYIVLICVIQFALNEPMSAQEFKFNKKLNKHEFRASKKSKDNKIYFDDVKYLTPSNWIVRDGDYFGVFNEDGKFDLPTKFEHIDHFLATSNLVKLNGQWGTYGNDSFTKIDNPVFRNPEIEPVLLECENFMGDNKESEKCYLEQLNIHFTELININGISADGVLLATAVINKSGEIEDLSLARGINKEINDLYITMIKEKMGNWKSGRMKDEPVNVFKVIIVRVKN